MGDSTGTLVTDFQGDPNHWGMFFQRGHDSPGFLGTCLFPDQHIPQLVEECSFPKVCNEFQSLLKLIKISLSYQDYDTTKYKIFVIFSTVEKLCRISICWL